MTGISLNISPLYVSLLYISLALVLVLALRKPARRWFGATPAFTLWLLPVLLAGLPWLPALPATWVTAPTLLVLPATSAIAMHADTEPSLAPWLLLPWLAGSLACLLRLALHYGRLLRQSRALPPAMMRALQADLGTLDAHRLHLHPAGPAVLWAPRSRLLLPPDFLERFDAGQRRLVLRHECAHLQRGDAWWCLLAELAFALLWFHPLAWLALPRLRLDQELACDERVLRQAPQDETRYAHTLLRSTGMHAMPVLTPWLAEPQLKERLIMIQRQRPGALRRRIGFVGVTALMIGSVFVAQAAVQTQHHPSASSDLNYNSRLQPHYPEDAIKNKQEGVVMLNILVGTDGKPRKIEVDPTTQAAPSLVKAASDAAMQWHFNLNPSEKNGKPVEGYAKVPVKFSLSEADAPAAPTAPPHASSSL